MANGRKRKQGGSYRVLVGSVDFRVPAAWWRQYVARGWLRAIGARLARVVRGVSLLVIGGEVVMERAGGPAPVTVPIPSSWRWVERAAQYDLRGGRLTPEALQREVQVQYGVAGFSS